MMRTNKIILKPTEFKMPARKLYNKSYLKKMGENYGQVQLQEQVNREESFGSSKAARPI